jgi:hypothetical protein
LRGRGSRRCLALRLNDGTVLTQFDSDHWLPTMQQRRRAGYFACAQTRGQSLNLLSITDTQGRATRGNRAGGGSAA